MARRRKKAHGPLRYWGVRSLAATISLACIYVALAKWDVSTALMLAYSALMGWYGFRGRDLLDDVFYGGQ